ncbi:MAG: hypothetical protein V4469_04375 [Patescibacteria group bacterium]
MTITNTLKPTPSVITNSIKTSNEETWNSNLTTWNTEVRTWDQMGTKITNTAKVTSSITNSLKPA